jgi:hypothetical protein
VGKAKTKKGLGVGRCPIEIAPDRSENHHVVVRQCHRWNVPAGECEAHRILDETSAAVGLTERVKSHSQIKVSENALIVGERR